MKVLFERRRAEAVMPTRMYRGDVGWDWWFQIAPRSGLAARGLMVLGGVVDPGFRGELVALLGWMAPADAEVWVLPAGSRIAQLLPHQRPSGIEDEGSRERGERGLGSSGV